MIAANIMTTDVIILREGMTVQEALMIMGEKRIRQLPVIDGDGKVLGILTSRRLLEVILPRYITERLLKDVKFAPDLPQLYQKLQGLAQKDVRDIMDRKPVKIGPEVSLLEVATIFVNAKRPLESILVVDDEDRLLGIIAPWDVCKTVCKYSGE
ncbi:MAG: CBS domain-containing protein [Deltaproteobacteria bacterium]|nr:CBS domain-containing protein [Deltaproteobacteria bacterium]